MPKRFQIRKLRHRVHLCSQGDVMNEDGQLVLKRKGVQSMWAGIEPKKANRFSAMGANIDKSRSKTHVIYTRYHPDIDVTSMAWIYEERAKSAPRWFQVLNITQTEDGGTELFMFECRLRERSVDASEPLDPGTGPAVGPL